MSNLEFVRRVLTLTGRLIVLLPVWFTVLCIQPFLAEDHPWKHKRNTPLWWAKGGTAISLAFSAAIWIMCLSSVLAFWMIGRGHAGFALLIFVTNQVFALWFIRQVPP